MRKKNMTIVIIEQKKTRGTGCSVSSTIDNGYVKIKALTILIIKYKRIALQNNER